MHRPAVIDLLERRHLLAATVPSLLADLNLNRAVTDPKFLTAIGPIVFFNGADSYGRNLWRTDVVAASSKTRPIAWPDTAHDDRDQL